VRRFAITHMCAMLIHFCVVMINVLRTHDTSPMTNEVLKEKTLVAVSTSPNSKFKFKMNDFQLATIVVSFVSDRFLLPSEPSNAIDIKIPVWPAGDCKEAGHPHLGRP
jgi:hypothetical protein